MEAQGLEGVAHLGSEDDREGAHWSQERRVIRGQPTFTVGCETSRADREVNVRGIERVKVWRTARTVGVAPSQRGSPRSLSTAAAAQRSSIVEGLLVTEGQGAQLGRDGEIEQEVRNGDEERPLSLQPGIGLFAMAFGTVASASGYPARAGFSSTYDIQVMSLKPR